MAEATVTAQDTTESVKDPTPMHRKIREQDEKTLLSYLSELNAETAISVAVIRLEPKVWGDRSIEGTQGTFDEPISEDEIRQRFGGGKYKLMIQTPGPSGAWRYAATRRITIAGDPKLDHLIKTPRGDESSSDDADVVKSAMRMSFDMAKQESRRADDERERTAAAVQAAQQVQPPRDSTIDFVLQEMAALRQQVASKDEKLLELATARPDSSSSDILLGKMVEGDSARMLAMRQQIDSELRMKNEMHKSEMDRLHSRYEDIARRQEDAHQRELTMAGQSTENGQALLKLAYESQIAGFQRELQMLSGQLQIAQSEVAILREKKDKSPVEHLTELAALKEALSTFAGSEKEEGGTIERMMNSALGSPLAEGIAARLAGVAPPAGAPDPQQQAVTPEQVPVNVPVHLPDGRIAVRKPDGTLVALQARKKPPGPTGEEGVTISDEDVGMAIQFMEAALASDTDPVDFARTARSVLTSGAIQAYLAAQGVDAFLARVANLKANSPLLQQHGKNWTRKVAAALLE